MYFDAVIYLNVNKITSTKQQQSHRFSFSRYPFSRVHVIIGVIYGGTRGTGTPTFWTEGYHTPTFWDENVKNLLSSAASRGDLWRLNYNKAIFGRSSAPDPTVRARGALPDPRVEWEGITSPHSPSLLSRDPMALRSPSKLVPPLFRPKLRPCMRSTKPATCQFLIHANKQILADLI